MNQAVTSVVVETVRTGNLENICLLEKDEKCGGRVLGGKEMDWERSPWDRIPAQVCIHTLSQVCTQDTDWSWRMKIVWSGWSEQEEVDHDDCCYYWSVSAHQPPVCDDHQLESSWPSPEQCLPSSRNNQH